MAITVDPNEPFHVLLGGQVTPVSLEVLDALYQDDTIEESTLIWQQGLGEWLRLDAVLAELEKQEPPAPQQREVEPDSYYVNFGDSDVRLLSLDQLDKFFDLEVIDGSTLVWQPGFAEWVPLALLIGEVDAPPVSIHPSMGPQPSASRAPAAGPAFSAPAFSAPAPVGFSSPSSRPAQTFSAPAPLGLSGQGSLGQGSLGQGSLGQGSLGQGSPSRPASIPAPSRPYSLAPNSMQEAGVLTLSALPQAPKASPWFGRGLLAASLFVGLLALQRNGVMAELAEGAGQQQSWREIEASMGGTSLDTPQGLAVWLSDLSARHGLASLTPTEPVVAPEPKAEASPAPFKLAPLPPPAPASELRPPSAAQTPAPSGDAKAVDVAEKMRAKLAGEPAPSGAPVRAISRPAKASAKKKKSSGADAYDPMNGTL